MFYAIGVLCHYANVSRESTDLAILYLPTCIVLPPPSLNPSSREFITTTKVTSHLPLVFPITIFKNTFIMRGRSGGGGMHQISIPRPVNMGLRAVELVSAAVSASERRHLNEDLHGTDRWGHRRLLHPSLCPEQNLAS